MPRIIDVVFVGWLVWCTLAYMSPLIGVAVTPHVTSLPAAALAALVGMGLAVHAWRQRTRGERELTLVWPHAWARSTQLGVLSGAGWLAILTHDVANGSVRSVFGIFIVLGVLSGFLRRPRQEHGSWPIVAESGDATET